MPYTDEFGRPMEDTRRKESRYGDPHREAYDPKRRRFGLTALANLMPSIPGLPMPQTAGSLKSYAAWPVWSDSTRKPVRFQPIGKKAAVKLWHRAREFDRHTHVPGKHGGIVGRTALAVLHALIFDFLNFKTGQLDPSYAKIAAKAGVCVRSVANALKRLRELGILNWVRRCIEDWQDGRYTLEQVSNAYAVLPASQWRGYKAPPEPEAPSPDTWGATPPLPSQLDQAAEESHQAAAYGR